MIPPKHFGICFPPRTGGCSEGLEAFIFFFELIESREITSLITPPMDYDQSNEQKLSAAAVAVASGAC